MKNLSKKSWTVLGSAIAIVAIIAILLYSSSSANRAEMIEKSKCDSLQSLKDAELKRLALEKAELERQLAEALLPPPIDAEALKVLLAEKPQKIVLSKTFKTTVNGYFIEEPLGIKFNWFESKKKTTVDVKINGEVSVHSDDLVISVNHATKEVTVTGVKIVPKRRDKVQSVKSDEPWYNFTFITKSNKNSAKKATLNKSQKQDVLRSLIDEAEKSISKKIQVYINSLPKYEEYLVTVEIEKTKTIQKTPKAEAIAEK